MTQLRILIVIALAGMAGTGCVDAHSQQLARANRALEADRVSEAIDAYSAAIRARPDSGVASFNLGYAHYRQGKFEESGRAFETASRLLAREERAHALYNLGNASAEQGKLHEALAAYRSSLRLRPGDDDARYNYVLVESRLDAQTGARADRDRESPAGRLTSEEAERLLDALPSGRESPERARLPRSRRDW